MKNVRNVLLAFVLVAVVIVIGVTYLMISTSAKSPQSTPVPFETSDRGQQSNVQWIAFYNPTDEPPALPFLKINFHDWSKENVEVITMLQSKLTRKVEELGGVDTPEKLDALREVMHQGLREISIPDESEITIEFPTRHQGPFRYQKKPSND